MTPIGQSVYDASYFLSKTAPQGVAVSDEPILVVMICTRARFSQTLLCMNSMLRVHSKASFILLLADRTEDPQGLMAFLPHGTLFVQMHELDIPYFDRFTFQYTPDEVCSNLKAFGLMYAVERAGGRKVIFADGDLFIFTALTELLQALDKTDWAICPHHAGPVPYNRKSEQMTALTGVFNGGIMAVRDTPRVREFLFWWQERTVHDSFKAPWEGFMADQKWLDQLPVLLPGCEILLHLGYDISWWNIHQRPLDFNQIIPRVSEEPVRFLHLTGVRWERKGPAIEPHLDPFYAENLAPMIQGYREALWTVLSWPRMPDYTTKTAYCFFTDGTEVTFAHRDHYRRATPWPHEPSPFAVGKAAFDKAVQLSALKSTWKAWRSASVALLKAVVKEIKR